ncbi:hypothetical protein HU200_057021 [Digitaria exilis]|uniref:F-box domain-containing protein n=1 Tax=Digitaria exilis TaxID=1010633 RepID=A0A835AQN2_9POAL|nr:hypothetical protein HU200_057021 [Digitaria exilis]
MADRLSSLPDDLLHSILRDLPLKYAVRTSALSRRWVSQWLDALAASPVLDFTDRDFARGQPPARAAATVGRCLRLHAEHGAPLDAFRVALVALPSGDGGTFGRDVVGWVAAAVARGARELEVDLPPSQERKNAAPHGDRFQIGNSLERLAFGRLSLRAVPLPAAGLAGLRSLSLSHADVTDEALRVLLANCRALESLSLRCCSLLTAVSVASERLRVLELLGCRAVGELRVAAPALESFTLYGNVILSAADWAEEAIAVDFGATPALRDVYLSHMDCCGYLDFNHDHYYPFVYYVPYARILTLCSIGLLPYVQVNMGNASYIDMPNLQELQLLMSSLDEEGDADPRHPERVYYFFHHTSFPVLKRLFIRFPSNPTNGSCSATAPIDGEDDEDVEFGYKIVLGQLTFIKAVNFRGTSWREWRLVGFLLKRAPVLEQLVLVTVGGDGAPGDEQLEVIQERALVLRKASRDARISVCRPSEDDSPNHAHTRFFHEEFCCVHQE